MNEVADVLDNISANPLHTPALYSGFLRALISAKWDVSSSNTGCNGDGDEKLVDGVQGNVTQGDIQTPNSYGQQQQSYGQEPSYLLNDFQFDSEMGPVADITTFPPTMAPYPPEDNMGVLAVDNILSSGFWDSMLVPGKSSDQLCVFVRYANFFSFQGTTAWIASAVVSFSEQMVVA